MNLRKPPVLFLFLFLLVLSLGCGEEKSSSAERMSVTPALTGTPDPAALQATLEAQLPPVPTPNEEGHVLRILEAVTVLPLENSDGAAKRWLAYTSGLRGIDPPRYHALEVYEYQKGTYVLQARHELDLLDALGSDGIKVSVEEGTVWIEVRGRGGLFSECFTLLKLEETTFTKEIEQCFREF